MTQAPPATTAQAIVSVRWDGRAPVIIDQRRLPDALVQWRLATVDEVVEAIRTLAVRGARRSGSRAPTGWSSGWTRWAPLRETRRTTSSISSPSGSAPPADRGQPLVGRRAGGRSRPPRGRLPDHPRRGPGRGERDPGRGAAACAAIAAQGRRSSRVAPDPDPLQHGPARDRRRRHRARHRLRDPRRRPARRGHRDEARPLLQGGRLTAWELARPASLPAHRRRRGRRGDGGGLVDAVIVGCDRVAANGDTANKIGTYGLAVLARHHGIPFCVAGPRSIVRLDTPTAPRSSSRSVTATRCGRSAGRRVAPPRRRRLEPGLRRHPGRAHRGASSPTAACIEPPYRRRSHREPRSASRPMTELETRQLLVELLGAFHARGWVSGTGGGICGPADGGGLLLAPTGVHKERVSPTSSSSSTRRTGTSSARRRTTACARASATRSSAWPPGSAARRQRRPLPCALRGPRRRPRRRRGPPRDPRPRDAQGHPGRRQPGRPPRAGDPQHAARGGARGAADARARRPALPRRAPSSSPTTAPTSGATRCGRRSATPRSTTSCSRPRSRGDAASTPGGRPMTHERARRQDHYLCPTCQQRSRSRRSTSSTSRRGRGGQADRGGRVQADLHRARHPVERVRVPGACGAVPHARPRRPTTRSATCSRAPARSRVGGVTRPVKQGDVWVIPANTPHGGQFEDAPQVLFISSPIDDPDNQDRVWID